MDADEVKHEVKYGPTAKKYFWFKYPHELNFRQALSMKIFCPFQFGRFPFDSHVCNLTVISATSTIGSLTFPKARVQIDEKEDTNGKALRLDQASLPFDISLWPQEQIDKLEIDFTVPGFGLCIFLKRNSLGPLLGSFYFPTGTFALLASVSYTINPDKVTLLVISMHENFSNMHLKVPGRLGLLVTLYLIATNVYNSVEAPQDRGFSYIELWMVGMQLPILLAIIEYGIILAFTKRPDNGQPNNKKEAWTSSKNFEKVARSMDVWSFVASVSFTVLFIALYVTSTLNESFLY